MREGFWQLIYSVCQRITWLITFVSMQVFTDFSYKNIERIANIPTPLLIVANHRSYWDPLIIGTLFPFFSNHYLPIGFMAADTFFSNPLFKIFFTLTGTYPAYKGMGLDKSLLYPRSVLKKKGVVLIFPFGKILIDENQEETPRRGAGALVKEFDGLWILPIYLDTSPNMSFYDFLFKKKKMSVYIGNVFQADQKLKEKKDAEISSYLVKKVMMLSPDPQRT